MKKYPKYKDSEIEYISEIPLQWEVWKLKFLVKEKLKYGANEAAELDDRNLPRYIRITDFDNNGKLREETFKSLPFEIAKDYLLKNGDLLFARSGATVGKTLLFDKYDGIACFAGYLIKASCDSKKMDFKFLDYYTSSSSYENWKDMIFIQSTIQNIGADKYNLILVPKPPLPEQHTIVQFLDHKTSQIDRFIANRQKQIELLKEQKAAIINKAVTKGINPNAKMKDSGIEWIGEVPEHWMIGKVRRVLNILTDFTANGSFADLAKNVKYLDTPDYSRLIRLTDLREDLKNEGIYVNKEAHKFLAKSELFGGEILMANVGAYAGLVCLVPKLDFVSTLGPNMFLLKFDDKRMSNQFAFTLLSSDCYYKLLMNKALSSAQPKLNKEDVKSIDFIFPPTHEEQDAIIEFIIEETSNVDTLISKYQKQIDLMQE